MTEFSVLIPVYNEEEVLAKNVGRLMNYLESQGLYDYRIIVCSNGSTDSTDRIGADLQAKYPDRFTFISIPERGVGLAFREMVSLAKTEKLVSIDVDLTSDLGFIPECVSLLGESSLVIGSKRKGTQERQWYRLLISGVFIGLVRMLLGLSYDDYSIGTKGYRRSDIIDYVGGIDHGSSYVIEMVYYVERARKNISVVPVYCNDNRASRFNIVHEIFYRFRNLVGLWWRVRVCGK
jgi:glycosyltransferase involved in cell wall biosynthesis